MSATTTVNCWPGYDAGIRPLMRRRTKEQVAPELPLKQESNDE